jgi:ribulose-phosphate 3-epimerase
LTDEEARRLADRVRDLGATAGLAINPATDAARIRSLISVFEVILIMSVNPGFSGQRFRSEVLSKAREIRPLLREDQRLQIDGGISPTTATAAREAGCDVLVAASAVFGQPPAERSGVIQKLRGSA